jgi:hypothetical protein
VNEDNVDLNRNFIDWTAKPPENPAYADLHPALVVPAWDGPERIAADEALAELTRAKGQTAVSLIIEAGQYAFADGLFYGGNAPVWSNRVLTAVLEEFGQKAGQVIVFDVHTGAGPYGYPALLSVSPVDHAGLAWGAETFGPAMVPVITFVIANLPALLIGAFLIERFFSIPGIGREIILAVERSDFPVIKAATVTVAIATMVFNLIGDLLYKLADPRVRLE